MDQHKEVMVPYVAYEAEMMRVERRNKRSFWLTVVLIVALLISNLAWLWAWTQYDYSSAESEITVDSGDRGIASYIGHDGDFIYGESSSETKNADAH